MYHMLQLFLNIFRVSSILQKKSITVSMAGSLIEDEYVLDFLEGKVRSDNSKFRNVFEDLEKRAGRQLCNLELSYLEMNYVDILLKIWLEESFRKVFDYLENETNVISIELFILLMDQFQSMESIRDIEHPETMELVKDWCGGKRLELILDQSDVFETTPHSSALVANYFKHLKKSCIDVVSHCLNVRHNTNEHVDFISALHTFLTFANAHMKRSTILPDDVFINKLYKDDTTGRELFHKLVELCADNFPDHEESPLAVINFQILAVSLTDEDWTNKLDLMIKETCKKLLLPAVTCEAKTEGGRRIVVVRGTSISISKVKGRMLEMKNNSDAQEIQIVGMACVRVDCHLEKTDWHGTNLVVVTDKIVVDKDSRWDLSGNNVDIRFGADAASGRNPGEDGRAGVLFN